MLKLDSVVSGYGLTNVVHGVSLSVAKGEAVAILGRNGVGKTTLMKTIAGLIQAKSGTIWLDARDISKVPADARAGLGVGYVSQGKDVFERLTVLENIMVAASTQSWRKASLQASSLIEGEFSSLAPFVRRRAGTLSGGQRQLVSLAGALLREPSVLLLDEPTEGLQPSLVDELAKRLIELRSKRGLTLVIVEQRLEFAAQVSEKAYLMVKGELVREVSPSALLTDTRLQHEYLGI